MNMKRRRRAAFWLGGILCSFFNDGRTELWEEKIGMRPKFAGNEATEWGIVTEEPALERYQEVTGHIVTAQSFKVLGDTVITDWMGASPDGLIQAVDSRSTSHIINLRLLGTFMFILVNLCLHVGWHMIVYRVKGSSLYMTSVVWCNLRGVITRSEGPLSYHKCT